MGGMGRLVHGLDWARDGLHKGPETCRPKSNMSSMVQPVILREKWKMTIRRM